MLALLLVGSLAVAEDSTAFQRKANAAIVYLPSTIRVGMTEDEVEKRLGEKPQTSVLIGSRLISWYEKNKVCVHYGFRGTAFSIKWEVQPRP